MRKIRFDQLMQEITDIMSEHRRLNIILQQQRIDHLVDTHALIQQFNDAHAKRIQNQHLTAVLVQNHAFFTNPTPANR